MVFLCAVKHCAALALAVCGVGGVCHSGMGKVFMYLLLLYEFIVVIHYLLILASI